MHCKGIGNGIENAQIMIMVPIFTCRTFVFVKIVVHIFVVIKECFPKDLELMLPETLFRKLIF